MTSATHHPDANRIPNMSHPGFLFRILKQKKLLQQTRNKYVLVTSPADFTHGKNTFYVESYNNVMKCFQSNGGEQYQSRAMIACMHWIENVNRESTSIWQYLHNESRQKKNKQKNCTTSYLTNIYWVIYVHHFACLHATLGVAWKFTSIVMALQDVLKLFLALNHLVHLMISLGVLPLFVDISSCSCSQPPVMSWPWMPGLFTNTEAVCSLRWAPCIGQCLGS